MAKTALARSAGLLVAFGLGLALVAASVSAARALPLAERLTPALVAAVFPGAESLAQEEGQPPAIAVSKGGQVVGYLYSTLDVMAAPGYSGIPFDVIAGVTLDGVITGARMIHHREPYILNDRVRTPLMDTYLTRHAGYHLNGTTPHALTADFIAGATISGRAMRVAVVDSARFVLRARSPRPPVREPTLDREGFRRYSWAELIENRSIVRRVFSNDDVREAITRAAGERASSVVELGEPGDMFIELHVGLATPQAIGRTLLSGRNTGDYLRHTNAGGHVIAVASNGPYEFLSLNYFNTGRVDRLRMVQEDRTYGFERGQLQRLGNIANTGPTGPYHSALFFIPPERGFDPLKPWRLELLVQADAPDGRITVPIPIEYRLPAIHILMPDVPPEPAWIEAWREQRPQIAILGAALVVLTLLLAFQGRLARHRTLHRWARIGFLAFVLVWVGWIAGAQLSIVNVINYVTAPLHPYDLGFYLAEPLIVMIAAYTAVSLLVLGRGVFCGWLCPFGALQELLARAARALRLPQWNPAEATQRRLWWGKYASAALVIGLAIVSVDMAFAAAEIEPFKTAITSHFTRTAPHVAYAVILLGLGLFTERAFCRFLCPLGGVLGLLDRLHLVNLLKRRPECGSPCHLCERSCPVKAIETSGRIKMAECFQCLDCQVEYHDDQRCPPLAATRKPRARALAPTGEAEATA